MVVLKPPHILAGNRLAEVRDREAGAGASAYLACAARPEPPADQPGNRLTQRLMGIPGDCHRLSVKILREVDRGSHVSSITSSHHAISGQECRHPPYPGSPGQRLQECDPDCLPAPAEFLSP